MIAFTPHRIGETEMKYCMIVFIATGLLLASTSGWSASTKQEIKELKAQVAEVQVELAEIKKLLQEAI